VPDLPRSHLVLYGLAAVAVLVFGVHQVAGSRDREALASAPAIALDRQPSGNAGGRIVVHVAGAVVRPGVYRVQAGARVDDAVRRAGGPRRRADLTQVNLAQKLEDGRQVIVPERPPAPPKGGAPGVVAAVPVGPINLNTATLEQLDELDGIGPVTAQQILDYREAHGGFANVEDLDNVPGIGEATMAALRDKVTA
jgi:competence protein ComEA